MTAPLRSTEQEAQIARRFKRSTLGWLVFFTLIVGLGVTVLVAHAVSESEDYLYNRLLRGFLNESLSPEVFSAAQSPDEPRLTEIAALVASFTQARHLKFKAPTGEIVWSDDAQFIGLTEQSNPAFKEALQGQLPAHYEAADHLAADAETAIQRWLKSLTYEVYIPISGESDRVVGVVEVYQPPRISGGHMAWELTAIWVVLGIAFGAYLVLSHRLFTQASDQIVSLRAELDKDHRLAVVGQGVSKIVHDARNVLAAVRFACARLASEDMSVSQRRQLCEELDLPVGMTFRMLEDLLAFVSGKPVAFRGQNQELLSLIEDLLPLLSPMLEAARHRLVLDVPKDLIVYGDRDKIAHILINLASNSTEAMSTPGEIRIAAAATDEGVQITVGDTGSGIDDELLPHLFEPFVSHPDKARPGLGLSIVQDLVRQHGGEISARNRPGGGAEFVLAFPNRPLQQSASV